MQPPIHDLGDFFDGLMHNRRHDMRGTFACQLNDILAEIGFGDFKAGLLQMVVEMNFFRHHRLGFDNPFDPRLAGDRSHDLLSVGSICGEVNVTPTGDNRSLEFLDVLIEVRQSMVFNRASFIPQ